MKRENLTVLFPYQDSVTWNTLTEETLHDLGIDFICEKVTADPKERVLILQILGNMTADARVTRFRCEVFDDLYRNPDIRKRMLELLGHVKFLNDYGTVRRPSEEAAGLWDLLHRLDEINDYISTVEALEDCLKNRELHSEGMRELRRGIEVIRHDSGFDELKKDISNLKTDANSLKSVTVGINLNERMEATGIGLIAANSKFFTRSNILRSFSDAISRKDQLKQEAEWDGSMNWHPATGLLDKLADGMENVTRRVLPKINPIAAVTMARVTGDDGTRDIPRTMDSALNNLLSATVRKLRDTLNKYATVSIREMTELIPELVFYVRWAEYIERLRAKGWQFCEAEAEDSPDGAPQLEAKGFYNLKLTAVETPESTVANDLDFDAEKRVYLLTGANRGGKTTVTQAVGQLMLLAQGGIYVPAESFRFTPADGIYTHFPADEDRTLDLGRLGEECKRFRELFEKCTESSLLLLNETFSTTSFEEGYYIAADAIRAILSRGTRTIYNTHMHKLAKELEQFNREDGKAKAVSLIVRSEGGKRSFRVEIAPPEGTSLARDIAEKYGVTYEALTGTAEERN